MKVILHGTIIFLLALIVCCSYRMLAINLLSVVVFIHILMGCWGQAESGQGEATGKCAEYS